MNKLVFIVISTWFVIIFSLGSCSKKKVNSHSTKNDILYHLNRGNTKEALDLIKAEQKHRPHDPDLAIYEASVYSIEAGIDIYSIFPLLKLKFFREPIANWDSLNKYENPYGNIFEDQESNQKDSPNTKTSDSDDDVLGSKIDPKENIKIQSYLMRGLWGLYESIPIVILIPSVDVSRDFYSEKAIGVLLNPEIEFSNIKKSQERYQFLVLIETLMLVSHLKRVVNFNAVHTPNDLICQTDPRAAVENYGKIRKYALDILEHVQSSNLLKKTNEKGKESIKSAVSSLNKLPEEFSIEQKAKFSGDIYLSQEKKCAQH